jgi:hypothetical protein
MKFLLWLLWMVGTVWGIGQIVEGVRNDNTGQIIVAVLLGIVALYSVSVVFNLVSGKTWTGDDRIPGHR